MTNATSWTWNWSISQNRFVYSLPSLWCYYWQQNTYEHRHQRYPYFQIMMRRRGQLGSPGWLSISDFPALSSSAGIMGIYQGTPYSMPLQTDLNSRQFPMCRSPLENPFPGVHSDLTVPWTTLIPTSMSPPSGRLSHTRPNRLFAKEKGHSYPKSHCYRPASSTFRW